MLSVVIRQSRYNNGQGILEVQEWVSVKGACGSCALVFKVHRGVGAKRFSVSLALVSDCNINQLFFASGQVKIQCVVVLVLTIRW